MTTYEEILSRMETKFEELAGYNANEASDIGIRLKVLAAEIFSAYSHLDWIKTQMFPQTATGERLDLHAIQKGITRKFATKATGTLTFGRTDVLSYDVSIPIGTICSTAEVDGIKYVTTAEAVLEAGETSVDVTAEAEIGGVIGNTLKETITVLITPPSGISSVINKAAFEGGTDDETDEELRKRICDAYSMPSNGTNCAFYRDYALSFNDVYSVNVVPRASGIGTVDIYVAGKGQVLSDEIIEEIQSGISSIKEINVDATVKSPTILKCSITATVYIKDGYRYESVIQDIYVAIKKYFDTLSIGESMDMNRVIAEVCSVQGLKKFELTSTLSGVEVEDNQFVVLNTIGYIRK